MLGEPSARSAEDITMEATPSRGGRAWWDKVTKMRGGGLKGLGEKASLFKKRPMKKTKLQSGRSNPGNPDDTVGNSRGAVI